MGVEISDLIDLQDSISKLEKRIVKMEEEKDKILQECKSTSEPQVIDIVYSIWANEELHKELVNLYSGLPPWVENSEIKSYYTAMGLAVKYMEYEKKSKTSDAAHVFNIAYRAIYDTMEEIF